MPRTPPRQRTRPCGASPTTPPAASYTHEDSETGSYTPKPEEPVNTRFHLEQSPPAATVLISSPKLEL